MASQQNDSTNVQYGKGLALLSLDGGGVRGLSSLYILQNLMEQLDPDNPPKPCDHFDLIGGTSTGGLLAIMLGRLRMTVEECIEAYNNLMPSVFEKTKHRFSVRKGKLQGRFDSEALTNGVKRVLKSVDMEEDELLKDPVSNCKTFVCVTRKEGRQTTVFSSYPGKRRLRDSYNATKIWEAARATSAATTFFDPITILDVEYVDGAYGANNPVDEIWTEAGDIWMSDTTDRLEDNISCFVSIGTGTPAFGAVDESFKGIVKTLKAIATDCESAAEKFRRQHRGLEGRYFRFNVPTGLEDIGLEEASRRSEIIAATRQYLELQVSLLEVEKFGMAMRRRQRISRICNYIREIANMGAQYAQDRSRSSYPRKQNPTPWITNTHVFDRWSAVDKCLYIKWDDTPNDIVPLEKILQAADGVLAVSNVSILHCVSIDWRNYARFDKTQKKECDKKMTSKWVRLRRRPNPKEVVVAFACLLLSHQADDNKLAKRVTQLSEMSKCILEVLASQSTIIKQSREDYRLLLKEYTDDAIIWLLVQSSMRLPTNSILLLSIGNIQYLRDHDLDNMLSKCYKVFRSELRDLSQVQVFAHTSNSVEGLHHLLVIDRNTEYNECIKSLEVARVNTRRDQILPPAPGTCEWLYSHPAFGFWEAEGGVLWIRGKPGSGKSTLVKRIVAGVQPQMSSVVTGAWFYSVKLESTQRSHHVLMKTLLHSFLCRDPEDFYKHIDLYRKIRTPEATLWTQHDLEMFLRRISTSPRDTSLIAVIDALDESEDGAESEVSRDHLTAFLLDLACHQQSRLRLIVTSRPYRSFTEAFRNCEQIVLEQVTKDDIATVVDRGLSWLRNSLDREQGQSGSFVAVDSPTQQRRRSRRQDRLKAIRTGPQPTTVFMTFLDDEFKSMREFLLANANGVFLWTTLVLRELERISKTPLFNVQDLKKILFSLPAELEDLYSMILARLVSGSDGLHKTRRILAWTIGTDQSRPLTLSMLFDAIGINENLDLDEYLDSKTDPFLPHKPVYGCNTWGRFAFDVYEQCGGLIDILPAAENWKPFQEYLEGEIDDEWVVTLLHKTALDYLATSKCPASLRMTESQAETIVNNGLMAYLQVYLPIKPRENSFHPRALTVHEKNIQDTSEPEDRMLYSLEDDKITYDVLGYGQTIKQHFSLEQAPNNQDGTEPLLNGVGLWLETLDPRSLDSDYEYRLHTRYFATKLSETVAKCKDRLFASPDLELLTYLQERQLLCFALDILPLQWEMNHEEGIQKYRCLETLNKAASETSPIWLSWLQSIPGSAFLAICEYNFDTALEIIQCLLAFNKESLSRAARAIPGAIMLFCSQHGPEKYVPGATQAFFSELRSECNLNSIDLSLVYEMSLMCNERGYSNLGWYLAWRWSEHISEDRLLSQSMKCDLELEGIYRGLGGIADVPQFSLHINSMDNPEQYTTWVDVHAMAESLGVLKDVEDESAFVPRPLASLAPDSSSERPPGTKSCGAIDLMPRRFSMSSLVNISTFKRCHSWTYRIPASPFSRVSDYSGSCDEPVPSCLHDQAEGKKPRLWSLLTDQVGQHQRLQHHTSII